MKKYIVSILISVVLTGCLEDAQKEEVKTVDWYLQHNDELNKKIKECENNPGELANTPNCQNAIRARHKKGASNSTETLNSFFK